MTKVTVKNQVFEILGREELEEKIDEVNAYEIYEKTLEEALRYGHSGCAYTYMDARSGEIRTNWLSNGSYLHPFDSFYEITLCQVKTGTDSINLDDEEYLLSEDERKEYRKECEEKDDWITPVEWLRNKFPDTYKSEYEGKREAAIDWLSMEFELDHGAIDDQIGELYTREA